MAKSDPDLNDHAVVDVRKANANEVSGFGSQPDGIPGGAADLELDAPVEAFPGDAQDGGFALDEPVFSGEDGQEPLDPDADLEVALDQALARVDAPMQAVDAVLMVLKGRDVGRMYGITSTPILIGRAATAQVRLDAPAVSQRHAVLECDGGRYWLRDLDSANGTLVNGKLIDHPTELSSGDQIEFVDTMLVFSRGDESTVQPTVQLARRQAAPAAAPLATGTPEVQWLGARPFSPPDDDDHQPTFEERLQQLMVAFAYVKKHWRLLVALPAVFGLLGLATLAVFKPPGTVTFMVSLTPNPQDNPLSNSYQQQPERPDRQFFKNAAGAFSDERLIGRTLERLGDPPDPNRIRTIKTHLVVEQVNETLFSGTLTAHDQPAAVRFLTAHLENYLESEITKTLKVFQAEVDMLNSQVQEAEASLDKRENALRKFRQENIRNLPEVAEGRIAGVGNLEGTAAGLSARASRLEAELALARSRLARASPLIQAKVAAASPYQAALDAAKQRLAQLKASGLGDAHPDVRQAQNEVENLKRQVQETTSSAPSELEKEANPEYTALKDKVADLTVELRGIRASAKAVGGQLGSADEALRELPRVEAEQAKLTRTLDTDRELLVRLIERLRQAETQLEIERATARARYDVIQPPRAVGVAIRKAIAVRGGIGILAGLALAVLIAMAMELRAIIRRLPRVEIVDARVGPGKRLGTGHR